MSDTAAVPPNVPPADLDSDDACLRRVAALDPDAMEPIFARWKLPLLSFFYRATGSRADAEDLTLLTLERVYRSAPRYRSEGRFAAWLFTIARRELAHEWRRQRRHPVQPVDPEELTDYAVDQTEQERRRAAELEEQLLKALRHCKDREREALILAASGHLNHASMAAILRVTESHLHLILHRGRKTLRRFFNLHSP